MNEIRWVAAEENPPRFCWRTITSILEEIGTTIPGRAKPPNIINLSCGHKVGVSDATKKEIEGGIASGARSVFHCSTCEKSGFLPAFDEENPAAVV